MKIIKNNIIPFKGFAAINLFGVVFVRNSYAERAEGTYFYNQMINHESIHSKQMVELLFVFYYIWYVIEWFIKCIYYFDTHKAYKNISFEREAYDNEDNFSYLDKRKPFNWLNRILR